MRFSKQRIEQIKAIMKVEFGRELTDEEAQLLGIAVIEHIIAKAKHESIVLKLTREEYYGQKRDTAE